MKKFFRILYAAIYCAVIVFCAAITVIKILPISKLIFAEGIASVAGGIATLIAGVFAAGFVSVLLHELAHLAVGKLCGFKAVSFKVLGKEFIKSAAKKRTMRALIAQDNSTADMQNDDGVKSKRAERHAKRMQKVMESAKDNGGEMSYGSCSLISVREGKYRRRLLITSLSGVIMSFVIFALSVVYLFLWSGDTGVYLTIFLAPFAIVCGHIFLSVTLPSYSGTASDGALAAGLIARSDHAIVTLALLNIQTQLYMGKTPSEIDKRLYFDLPVIADNTFAAAQLFLHRYAYYLDTADFENAAKTGERIIHCMDCLGYKDSTRIYLNILFDTAYKGDEGRAKAIYELIARDADLTDISDLRVLWYYHHKYGTEEERQRFLRLAENADSAFKGIYEMEQKLIKTLSAKKPINP